MSEPKPSEQYHIDTEEKNEPDEMHQIRDEAPHNHFTSIPNMVDDMNLSPYAFRLYAHIRRVAGESGICWQGTRTLAKSCNMSGGMISKCKTELSETNPPLIRIEKVWRNNDEKQDFYHNITITDIWGMNAKKYTQVGDTRSPHEHPHSLHEQTRSPGETKKNPIKKNPINTRAPLSQENQEKANRKMDAILENERKAQEKQSSGASWSGRDKIPESIRELLDVYVLLTGQHPTKGALLDWLTSGQEWIELQAIQEDIRAAYRIARPEDGNGFNVSRPGSLTRTIGMIVGERHKRSNPITGLKSILAPPPPHQVESVYFDPDKPFFAQFPKEQS